MGEKRELEVKAEHLVVGAQEKHLEADTKTPSESGNEDGKNIRRWFVELTKEDRMVALSFSDDLFLDAFLKIASSSSKGIVERSEGAALPAHAVLEPQNSEGDQWKRMFMIKEFSKLYEAFKEKANVEVAAASESVDNVRSPSIPSESDEEEMAPKQLSMTQEEVTENIKDKSEGLHADDAFRIHHSIDDTAHSRGEGNNTTMEKALAIAKGKRTAALALSSLAKQALDERSEASRVHHVLKSFHLVFPAAVEFVQSGASAENFSSPVFALSPSILENADELIGVFDAVLNCRGRAPFLSDSTYRNIQTSTGTPATANYWLPRLCGISDGESTDTTTTSLILLVVGRLEYAVFEAYAEAQSLRRSASGLGIEDAESSKPLSLVLEEADGSSSDQWVTAPEEDSSNGDQNTVERSLEGSTVSKENTECDAYFPGRTVVQGTKKCVASAQFLSPICYIDMHGSTTLSRKTIFSRLSSSVRMIDETCHKLSAGELVDAISPFLNLLDLQGSLDILHLRGGNLLMTPLIWFVRPGINLKAIGGVVESSLKRLIDRADSSNLNDYFRSTNEVEAAFDIAKVVVEAKDNSGHVNEAAQIVPCADDGCVDLSVSLKKLKKKKRRKKRKSMNADADALARDGPSMGNLELEAHEELENHSCLHKDKQSDNVVSNVTATLTNQDCNVTTAPSPISDTSVSQEILEGDSLKTEEVLPTSIVAETIRNDGVTSVDISMDRSILNGKSEVDESIENGVHRREESDPGDDDGSAWETVEIRARSNRKKSTERSHSGFGRSGSYNYYSGSNGHGSYSSYGGMHGSFSKRSKGARTPASRKRNANRKMVRDILSSVLDIVDEEVKRRKNQSPRFASSNNVAQVSQAPTFAQRVEHKKPVTLRDVVIGISVENLGDNQKVAPKSVENAAGVLNDVIALAIKNTDTKLVDARDTKVVPALEKPQLRSKIVSDQNTAPTVPETMSAVSANSMNTDGLLGAGSLRRQSETGVDHITRSDSSCEELIETQKDLRISCSTTDEKDSSPAPPLPTLLSPGNADSASSSVASSLEVPHGHRHHRSYSACENVGYHLLDVCDRLTRDMDVFMDRRGLALDIRRRQRGELLSALQDTLSKLWPGRCNVNMYGSCATQLDLPSSDLDVVVCGLDKKGETLNSIPSHQNQKPSSKKSGRRGNSGSTNSGSVEFSPRGDLQAQYTHTQTGMLSFSPFSHFNPVQIQSINGERVIRLAAELEQQPWAVHVKAVPTATVPVVKILADPAKLPGAKAVAAIGSDWISHHQQMAAQAAIAAGMSPAMVSSSRTHASLPPYHPLHTPLPWRGADVMNGLMSVDITFEGPEHGGIGSTKLSSRIVKEACEEYSCPPERVPLVQVLMVLKEMLAQRRLNEPFSGGLSSYALLLLVEALVKERAVIREELERVEKQRRVVAAGGGNSTLGDHNVQKVGTEKESSRRVNQRDGNSGFQDGSAPSGQLTVDATSRKAAVVKSSSAETSDGAAQRAPKVASDQVPPTLKTAASASSWASVAKKNTSFGSSQKGALEQQRSDEPVSVVRSTPSSHQSSVKPKVTTFADAVARSADVAKVSAGADNKRPALFDDRIESSLKTDSATSRRNSVLSSDATPFDARQVAHAQPASNLLKPVVAAPSNEAFDQTQQSLAPLNQSDVSIDSSLVGVPQLFPQGSNDVVEVLCSGDTTAGKLLMHFLLFYGQHFDARTIAIDVSGKHTDVNRAANGSASYLPLSPYIQRRQGGTIDPISGMLTVDPIVVYDPLEGAENNNVARSCFLWSNIRWVFAQSYNTLSSAVERSPTPPTTPGRKQQHQKVLTTKATGTQTLEAQSKLVKNKHCKEMASWQTTFVRDDEGQPPVDSPLLELLLSF